MEKFLLSLAILVVVITILGLVQPELLTSKSGVPSRSTILKRAFWPLLALLLLAWAIRQLAMPSQHMGKQMNVSGMADYVKESRRLQPDMVVVFPHGGLSCQTQDTLLEASTTVYRDLKARAEYMRNHDGSEPCSEIKSDVHWRILSIQPVLDAMEIGPEGEKNPHSIWVLPSQALEYVKSPQ